MVDRCWLVTGGAGYIGAHVVRALVASGRRVVVVDDFSTGIASRLPTGVQQLRGSVADTAFLSDALRATKPDGVMHLAAKKSPGESMAEPLTYARENVGGVINLLEAIRTVTGITRIVFASSSSVYGSLDSGSVGEDAPKMPVSPYGESKVYGEQLFAAAARAYGLGMISLRYFNVVGAATPALADTSTTNLVPRVLAVLRAGAPPEVYGTDYPTPDGTCIRDYVDVEDVADAHLQAAALLESRRVCTAYNVGRGQGSSVLEVLDTVRAVTGYDVDHCARARRSGDPARMVGRVDRIAREVGWSARRTLPDMVAAAWAAESAASAAIGTGRPVQADPK